MTNLYLKTKHVTIARDRALNCLIVSWQGLCSSQQYRQIIEMAIELVRKENIKHWISDNTEGRVVAISDHNWLFHKFIEKDLPPLETISTIDSRNIFRNIAVEKLIEDSDKVGVKIHRFSALEEARKFIIKQDKQQTTAQLQQA